MEIRRDGRYWGRRKKERRGERKCVWEKAGVRGRVGRMRERERG